MALIAMAVHDTEENKRTEMTKQVLWCLEKTVDFQKNRLVIIDNNSCDSTRRLLKYYVTNLDAESKNLIILPENIGTARAINQAWAVREPGEHCIKMDNDIIVNQSGWIEEMEAAIQTEPAIGQVGLKRKDLWEFPGHQDEDYRSQLIMLPHKPGQRWQVVEKVKHCIGSCVMHSSALLDRTGYLYQPGLYGYDDVIMSHRTHLAGFYSCFLPHIDIDHIDKGETEYQTWKERHSSQHTQEVIKLVAEMYTGTKPIYYANY